MNRQEHEEDWAGIGGVVGGRFRSCGRDVQVCSEEYSGVGRVIRSSRTNMQGQAEEKAAVVAVGPEVAVAAAAAVAVETAAPVAAAAVAVTAVATAATGRTFRNSTQNIKRHREEC